MKIERFNFSDDVVRIINIASKNGWLLDTEGAKFIWDKYSDDCAAGWMHVSKDDNEVWEVLKDLCEKYERY